MLEGGEGVEKTEPIETTLIEFLLMFCGPVFSVSELFGFML